MFAIQALGWLGAAALLLAYGLVAQGRAQVSDRNYVLLNLFGSAGLATASAATSAWPSVAVNVIWLAIGLSALARSARARGRAEALTSPQAG